MPLGFFFKRVSNRINFKAVDLSYHVFFQARQKKVHSTGHYGAPCQPVLLHASLPINLAMPAPNRLPMINEQLNAHLAFLYPLFTWLYVLELAIQTQKVKGRRGTDTQKSAPPLFLF